MDVLALQPFDSGSHAAFLAGWCRYSRHSFTSFTLPGRHYKWRMRHAALTFADQLASITGPGPSALWCTAMLDLATLRGLSPRAASLPAMVYFHENQLAYPNRHNDPRDVHFGLTQMNTCLAAIASVGGDERAADLQPIAWNSAHNRDSFLEALDALLKKMPDHRPTDVNKRIARASRVLYPGIDPVGVGDGIASDSPPALLWVGRWEHDKRPELFFDALAELDRRGVGFRLNVVGEQFEDRPACFEQARQRFADRIDAWGYQPTRQDYEAVLRRSAVVVSTAAHEFFGLAVAEAVSAGCTPVLPDALAYPEVWGDAAVYHDGSAAGVADAIQRALALPTHRAQVAAAAGRYAWPRIAPQHDDAVAALVAR